MNGFTRFLDSLVSPNSAGNSNPERSWLDVVWRLIGCDDDDFLDLPAEPEIPDYYNAEAMDCLITPTNSSDRGVQPYLEDGGDRIYSYEYYRLVRDRRSGLPRLQPRIRDGEIDRSTGHFSLTYYLVDLPDLIFRRTVLVALVVFITYAVSIPAHEHNQPPSASDRAPLIYQDYYV